MITVRHLPPKKHARKNTIKKTETPHFCHALSVTFEELDALDAAEMFEIEKVEEKPVQVEEIVIEKPETDSSTDALMQELDNLDLNELESAVTADASPVELEALEKVILSEEKKYEEGLHAPTPAVDPLSMIMTAVKPAETIVKTAKNAEETSRETVKTVGIAGVLKNRIGSDISKLYMTEDCDEETMKKENETIVAMLDDRVLCSQKKVAEKMLAFFPFLTGHSNECNKVLRIAFTLLHKEGVITTTKNGNLFKALRSNGYSVGTATAQSGQVFALFQLLKIVKPNSGAGVVRRFAENLRPFAVLSG